MAPLPQAVPFASDSGLTTAPASACETVVTMRSEHTGREYRVQIFRPTVEPPPEGYPVVFFTDGEVNFRCAADQMLMRQHTDLRPAIVVGLAHPSDNIWDYVRLRSWDLTHDRPAGDFLQTFHQWARDRYTEDDAGGAESFYRFITEELRPWISGHLPINPRDQTLYGHSLGGLFGLHVLFNHTDAFQNYIISSPSLVWNGGSVLSGEPRFAEAVERGESAPRILFTRGGIEIIGGLGDLARRLRAIRGTHNYRSDYVVFPQENHWSVVPASIARALCFAYYIAGDYPDVED